MKGFVNCELISFLWFVYRLVADVAMLATE